MAEAHYASEVGTASTPTPCLRCGYDLQGLDGQTACPECGLLVALSRLDGQELRNNHPRWLLKLGIGARLAALGMFLFPATPLLSLYFLTRSFFDWRGLPPTLDAVLELTWRTAVCASPAIIFVVGVFLLCSRSGRRSVDYRGRLLRALLGPLSLMLLFPTLIMAIGDTAGLVRISSRKLETMLVALFAASSLLPILLAHHLKQLARRAPAPHLATDSPIFAWVLSGCIIVPLLLAILAIPGPNLGRDAAAFIGTTWLAVTVTAYFWSVMILLRFGWAFGRARSQALSLFENADFAASVSEPAPDPSLATQTPDRRPGAPGSPV